jgi:hypothetical protein
MRKYFMGFNDNKENRIEFYKFLSKKFMNEPSMEISSIMSDAADELHKLFGLSYEEIENIELSV